MTRIRDMLRAFKERRMRHLTRTESVSFQAFCNEKSVNENSFTQRYAETKESSFDDIKLSPVKLQDEEVSGFFKQQKIVVAPNNVNRPGLLSILLVIILLAVFLILPIIYLLHCFGIIYEQHHFAFLNEKEHNKVEFALQQEGHYEPGEKIHECLNEDLFLPPPPKPFYPQCRKISEIDRFDCYPENGANQAGCEARGCCWIPVKTKPQNRDLPLDTPYCFYPPDYNTYTLLNTTETAFGLIAFMKRNYQTAYPNDVEVIKLIIKYETNERLHIKITDAFQNRFEPPFPEVPIVDKAATNLLYTFKMDPLKSGFTVIRNSDNTPIFDASNWINFIYSNQFLQISSKLPSHNIYGIGEHQSNLRLSTKWTRFTLFNHDTIPQFNKNLYGSQPFYMVMENSSNSHGVLLLNSNAMDVILQPTPAITFRTIGGVLDFYFFLGPTPSDVISQYTDLIGRPYLPPYWSLGFHLCRFGYKTLNETKQVMERNLAAGIPIDTQWNDLDYMNNSNDFTYDKINFKGLPEFVKELHQRGMHYIPLIDPGVSGSERHGSYAPYDEGVKMDIFIKNSTGQIFIGKVWNKGTTVWPDFTHPNTVDYWTLMLKSLYEQVEFDGAWIDMNEPSNFWSGTENGCPKNNLETPPYLPQVDGGQLYYKTLCMSAKHGNHYLHYDVHNLYGLTEAIITSFALAEIRGKRPMVISRSTFIGHGHYAGHWSGDVVSNWQDMKYTIPQLINFNIFGIPLMGADICGFNGNTTKELCNRWMQLGAFYPFSRNHNTDDAIDQDPVALGDLVVESSKRALNIRYTLLPYLYTLFFKAHTEGETVARALFIEFPNDTKTWDIDQQFLWGPALMIIPVLDDNVFNVNAYLPAGIWYDYYNHTEIISKGEFKNLQANLTTIPLLIRGGFGYFSQPAGLTTTESRKNGMHLTVAFNQNGTGFGELYWDDGDSLNTYEEQKYILINWKLIDPTLEVTPVFYNKEVDIPKLHVVNLLGVKKPIDNLEVNGENVTFVTENSSIRIDLMKPPNLTESISIKWSYRY